VIVVGAGAAGLMAARELTRAGKKVVVLEASKRVGGRILTLHTSKTGIPVELGAEFIHGDAPETTRLVDEARLVTVPVLGEHYGSERGRLIRLGPVWKRIARVFRYMNADRKEDRSFQEFLDRKPGGRGLNKERELARGFVRGFYAADPGLISEKWLAEGGDPTESAAEARRIVHGYGALVEYLYREVTDRVRLNTAVRRVVRSDSGVRVIGRSGEEHRARAVIITVPLPVLQNGSIAIEPENRQLLIAARKLEMGRVMRVSFVVKERFWSKKAGDIWSVQTPTRPFNVWWTQYPMLSPLITAWAGGPAAAQLSEEGDAENVAIAELGRVFGMRRTTIESLVDSIHYHDWTRDPHIRGAYSYAGIGGASSARVLARTIDNTVFMAGEATDSESTASVEGALASGKRAARRVLDVLS
jgi:monoamine oxidase